MDWRLEIQQMFHELRTKEKVRQARRQTGRERDRQAERERQIQRQTGGLDAGDTADVPGAEGPRRR